MTTTYAYFLNLGHISCVSTNHTVRTSLEVSEGFEQSDVGLKPHRLGDT